MDRIASAEQHRRQSQPREGFRSLSAARLFRAPREDAERPASLRFLSRGWRATTGAEQATMVLGRGANGSD